MLKSETTAE